MTKTQAFLAQARSDLAVYDLLTAQSDLPACHRLHYLQMATEKLAKAARLQEAQEGADKTSHVAFSKLLSILKGNGYLPEALGMRRDRYRTFLDRARGLIVEIEALAPAVGASDINAEYPWAGKDAQGQAIWYAPMAYEFPVEARLRSSTGINLLKLVSTLASDFERVLRD